MPGMDMLKREIERIEKDRKILDIVHKKNLHDMATENKKLTKENAEYLDLVIQRNNEIRDLKKENADHKHRMSLLEKQLEHKPDSLWKRQVKEGNVIWKTNITDGV